MKVTFDNKGVKEITATLSEAFFVLESLESLPAEQGAVYCIMPKYADLAGIDDTEKARLAREIGALTVLFFRQTGGLELTFSNDSERLTDLSDSELFLASERFFDRLLDAGIRYDNGMKLLIREYAGLVYNSLCQRAEARDPRREM